MGKSNPLRQQLIDYRCRTADDVADWIIKNCPDKNQYPKYSANAVLVLIKVACALLNTHVERLADEFEEKGGFTERLYRVRQEARMKEQKDRTSDHKKPR